MACFRVLTAIISAAFAISNFGISEASYLLTVEDYQVPWKVGIDRDEFDFPQPLVVTANLKVQDADWNVYESDPDAAGGFVDYMAVVTEINTLAESDPHTGTLEAVAQDIALKLLALDERVEEAVVKVEKPRAVAGAGGISVTITRDSQDLQE